MTAPDRDPVALAREVLAQSANERVDAMYLVGLPGILDLARAVIDLTAKVERVEALADDLVADAQYVAGALPGKDGRNRAGERVAAAQRIRAALNGGDHE